MEKTHSFRFRTVSDDKNANGSENIFSFNECSIDRTTVREMYNLPNDLIIFGRNWDNYNKNLQDVFERIRKVNFIVNLH